MIADFRLTIVRDLNVSYPEKNWQLAIGNRQ
jgi:hypothetical protein